MFPLINCTVSCTDQPAQPAASRQQGRAVVKMKLVIQSEGSQGALHIFHHRRTIRPPPVRPFQPAKKTLIASGAHQHQH